MPHSRISARATIKVRNATGSDITIKPHNTVFTSGGNFNWAPAQTYVVAAGSEREIDLLQGSWETFNIGIFEADKQPHQRFPLTSFVGTTDIAKTKIFVAEDDTDGREGEPPGEEYTNITSWPDGIQGIDGTSPIFLLTTGFAGMYEIYFGDGVLGKLPLFDSNVSAMVFATEGAAANGQSTFYAGEGSNGIGVVSTVRVGSGGMEPESLESIRLKAPMFFQSQGRAVTANDLKSVITQENIGIAANAWGGEDEDPPQYGKVYITAYGAPNAGGKEISEELKTELLDFCERRTVVSILPVFKDPLIVNVELEGEVYYDQFLSDSDISDLISKMSQYIIDSQLMDFEKPFLYSKFAVGILDLDDAFIGDNIQTRISIDYDAGNREGERVSAVSGSIHNELANSGGVPGTVFNIDGVDVLDPDQDNQVVSVYVIDNGSGVLNAYRLDNNSLFKRNCGSVSYPTGRYQLDGLTMISSFRVKLRPKTNNVFAKGPVLLNVVDGGITLVS